MGRVFTPDIVRRPPRVRSLISSTQQSGVNLFRPAPVPKTAPAQPLPPPQVHKRSYVGRALRPTSPPPQPVRSRPRPPTAPMWPSCKKSRLTVPPPHRPPLPRKGTRTAGPSTLRQPLRSAVTVGALLDDAQSCPSGRCVSPPHLCVKHRLPSASASASLASASHLPAHQISEYIFGTKNRAVFLDTPSAYCGNPFIFCQPSEGPNLLQFSKWVSRSGPPVM